MKTLIVSFFVLLNVMGFGQANLNDYKYIIVPKQFEAFKKQNEHQTSTLVKFLFTEKGFNVVYDDALPDDLKFNRCLGLMASLIDDSTMFTTKTSISLTDCNGEEVFKTQQGKSKVKEFRGAYSEAIRMAMKSFNGVNYVYNNKGGEKETVTLNFKNDVKKLEEKNVEADVAASKPKNTNPMVVQQATTEDQLYKNREPVSSEIQLNKVGEATEILYAQKLANGYQLVDSTPKVRMKLMKSSTDNVYMAQGDGKSGMVYQKDGQWIFEYYEGDKLTQKELNIKF
ncbi:hypothetical protein J8L85_06590 [Maribacter sp. MMG018]|uniref:hypothetical protein n=1 Tax=Maribacter sp. MMG018 TaxID=2822688 RepID=UPI001B37E210|nr:hypothetical protein [Maribacter sp. MMG018]MBQ4914095.1 hypothetical protein [Maribacter sp. MMG018]